MAQNEWQKMKEKAQYWTIREGSKIKFLIIKDKKTGWEVPREIKDAEEQLSVKGVNNLGGKGATIPAAACKNLNCQKNEVVTIPFDGDGCNGAIPSVDALDGDAAGNRSNGFSVLEGHSHSIVPGGFEVRSYITREIPGTVKMASTIF